MDRYLKKGAGKKRKVSPCVTNNTSKTRLKEGDTSKTTEKEKTKFVPADISQHCGDKLNRPVLKNFPKRQEGSSQILCG